jgi:hypothetical protein
MTSPPPDVPTITAPPLVADIVQRADGFWSIGLHDDAAGPFESRRFAEQVRLARTRHDPVRCRP